MEAIKKLFALKRLTIGGEATYRGYDRVIHRYEETATSKKTVRRRLRWRTRLRVVGYVNKRLLFVNDGKGLFAVPADELRPR